MFANNFMLIANNGKQDKYLDPDYAVIHRIRIFQWSKDVTDCNTLILCHYKKSIVALLSIDVVMLICKYINQYYNPRIMFEFLDQKRGRAHCFNTFIYCIKYSQFIMPPKDVKKLLFKEYKKDEASCPKPFEFS